MSTKAEISSIHQATCKKTATSIRKQCQFNSKLYQENWGPTKTTKLGSSALILSAAHPHLPHEDAHLSNQPTSDEIAKAKARKLSALGHRYRSNNQTDLNLVELPPDQPKQSFVENNLDSTSLPIPGKDRPENPPYQQFPSAPAASDATTAGTPTHSGPQDNLIDSAPTPGADPLDLALRASQSPGPNPHLEILPTSAPGDEVQQPTSLAIKTPAFSHPNPHDSSAALSNSLQASPC
ncbi:hypothetical protein PtA15_2A288 [Puccinia triticina]|uniref:Uncharacterized protein n=1 Tax=Puccinia triticina TaxID=208348 RepID=A0ABY7CB17_9BASI|nr:uncharacterized protein PtA15_2A288 [Puccinia triticina]WAQ81975.1 hypothetical protein PtA15_2A288 [Puccinia triticina]